MPASTARTVIAAIRSGAGRNAFAREPVLQIAVLDVAEPARRELAGAEERQGRHGMDGEFAGELGSAVDIDAHHLDILPAEQAQQPLLDTPRRRSPYGVE